MHSGASMMPSKSSLACEFTHHLIFCFSFKISGLIEKYIDMQWADGLINRQAYGGMKDRRLDG